MNEQGQERPVHRASIERTAVGMDPDEDRSGGGVRGARAPRGYCGLVARENTDAAAS
jgi:hypothetical protein